MGNTDEMADWLVSDSEESGRGAFRPGPLPLSAPQDSLTPQAAGSAGLGPGSSEPLPSEQNVCARMYASSFCVCMFTLKKMSWLSVKQQFSKGWLFFFFFSFLIQQHFRSFHVRPPWVDSHRYVSLFKTACSTVSVP